MVYLDDVIMFGRTFQESLTRLDHVLSDIRDAGLKLHPGKCRSFRKEVKFLGHVVSHLGVSADPDKVASVMNFPRPENVHEVRQFVGLAS